MALPKFDNFNNGGVTQNLSAYDANYVPIFGTASVSQVINNHETGDAGGAESMWGWGGDTFNDDQQIQGTVAGITVNYAGFFLRAQGTTGAFDAKGYYWTIHDGKIGYFTGGGAKVDLFTGLTVPSVGDVCLFYVIGGVTPELHFAINGSDVGLTDTGALGPLSGGIPGMITGAPVAGNDGWDDVTFDNYPSTPVGQRFFLIPN